MSLKLTLHLRMVRTRVRDSYSAKPCPLIEYRSCSFAFRTRNSLRDKKLHDGKSVWVKNGIFGSSARSLLCPKTDIARPLPSPLVPKAEVNALIRSPPPRHGSATRSALMAETNAKFKRFLAQRTYGSLGHPRK